MYDYNAGSDQEISFKVIYLVDLGILTRVFKKDIHELVFLPFRLEMYSTC